MKRILWRTLAGLVWGALSLRAAPTQEAVAKSDNVNVRAQPKTSSEIVSRLKKGEPVVIIEEVTVKKPAKDEPAAWARIVFPTNTPVWVRAEFVDATNHDVLVKKLNVRAGPGENFSVIGLLLKGDKVTEIRVKEGWMEIPAPTSASAFVASELLSKAGVETNPPPIEVATNARADKTVAPVEPEKSSQSKPEPAPPALVANTAAAPLPAPPPPAANPATRDQDVAKTEPVPIIPAPSPPVTNAAPVEAPASPPPNLSKRRVISREGIVHRAYNLTAPTGFALENPDTGLMMDYLYSVNPAIKLKNYVGFRMIFTGEEGMDPRWPSTPVLLVQSVENP